MIMTPIERIDLGEAGRRFQASCRFWSDLALRVLLLARDESRIARSGRAICVAASLFHQIKRASLAMTQIRRSILKEGKVEQVHYACKLDYKSHSSARHEQTIYVPAGLRDHFRSSFHNPFGGPRTKQQEQTRDHWLSKKLRPNARLFPDGRLLFSSSFVQIGQLGAPTAKPSARLSANHKSRTFSRAAQVIQ